MNKLKQMTYKIKRNLKSLGILLTAGLAVAACTNDDAPFDQTTPPKNVNWTVTATIGKDADVQTRALNLSGNTLNVGWATTDIVYLKNATTGVTLGYLSPTTATNAATTTVTGTLSGTDYRVNESLKLIFPRADIDYTGQDGTLATIARKYDYATGTTTISSVSGSNVTLATTSLTSQQAIMKFTFSEPVTDVTITSSNINTTDHSITLNLASPQAVVYAAIPLNNNTGAGTTQFTCYNKSWKQLVATKSNIQMQNGKYYMASVNLEEVFDPVATPLTMEAVESGTTVTIYNQLQLPIMYRKTGNAIIQTSSAKIISITLTSAGDVVQFFGDSPRYCDNDHYYGELHENGQTTITCDKDCYVYGNVMSLISSTSFKTLKTLDTDNEFAFTELFCGRALPEYNNESNPHIINHPTKDIALPATTLSSFCYCQMFSLCPNLTRAPELPAPVLTRSCYDSMFDGCTNLNYVKCLATNISASDCTSRWLSGVSASGTFITPQETQWKSPGVWDNGIPLNWTRVNYVAQ